VNIKRILGDERRPREARELRRNLKWPAEGGRDGTLSLYYYYTTFSCCFQACISRQWHTVLVVCGRSNDYAGPVKCNFLYSRAGNCVTSAPNRLRPSKRPTPPQPSLWQSHCARHGNLIMLARVHHACETFARCGIDCPALPVPSPFFPLIPPSFSFTMVLFFQTIPSSLFPGFSGLSNEPEWTNNVT